MPKSRAPYPPEFRQRIIELMRKGRTPESLAEQSEPSAQTIRNWLAQADRDAGHRPDGLTTDEPGGAPPAAAREQDSPRRTGDPKNSRGLVYQGDRLDPIQGFEFVTAHRATHRLTIPCRVLGVSPIGYYAWRQRPLSARARLGCDQADPEGGHSGEASQD